MQRRRQPRLDVEVDVRSDVRDPTKPLAVALSDAALERLRELFARRAKKVFDDTLGDGLALSSRNARLSSIPLELLAAGLRDVASTATSISQSHRSERYSIALVQLLAISFGDSNAAQA